jgi:hypothetical protein
MASMDVKEDKKSEDVELIEKRLQKIKEKVTLNIFNLANQALFN